MTVIHDLGTPQASRSIALFVVRPRFVGEYAKTYEVPIEILGTPIPLPAYRSP